jgi:hypothetical protein
VAKHREKAEAPNDLSMRRGRLAISASMIDELPYAVMEIMGKLIIVQAQYLVALRDDEESIVIYHALSPHFRPIGEGDMPPDYQIVVECEPHKSGQPHGHEIGFREMPRNMDMVHFHEPSFAVH